MYIFVGNLPAEATLVDLKRFLGDHQMSVDFSAHRHQQNSGRHFVLIKTTSNEDADQLVKDIDGKSLLGTTVQARRWVERAATADWSGSERRFQQLDLDLIFSAESSGR